MLGEIIADAAEGKENPLLTKFRWRPEVQPGIEKEAARFSQPERFSAQSSQGEADGSRQCGLRRIAHSFTGIIVGSTESAATEQLLFRSRFLFRSGFLFRLALEQRDLFDARRIGRAPGRDVRIVFKSIVDDAPLVGIHRLELK